LHDSRTCPWFVTADQFDGGGFGLEDKERRTRVVWRLSTEFRWNKRRATLKLVTLLMILYCAWCALCLLLPQTIPQMMRPSATTITAMSHQVMVRDAVN
jgi:hypothetical protein